MWKTKEKTIKRHNKRKQMNSGNFVSECFMYTTYVINAWQLSV